MKNQNICKRILLCMLCAATAVPAVLMTSCGDKKNTPVKTKATNVYHSDVLMTATYNYNMKPGETSMRLNGLYGAGDRIIVTGYEMDDNYNSTDFMYSIDTETGEKNELSLPTLEDDTNNSYRGGMVFAPDGSMWYTVNSYGEDPDTGSYREDLYLYHIGTDGILLAKADMYDFMNINRDEQYLYLGTMVAVEDGLFFATDSGLYEVDSALSSLQSIPLTDIGNVNTMFLNGDNLYIAYSTAVDWKQQMVKYNRTTKQISEPLQISSSMMSNIYSAMPSDTYDFTYSNQLAVYGCDIETNTTTELLNWINSDIDASNTGSTFVAPNGVIYSLIREYNENSTTTSVVKMTRIPDEDVKEKYIFTYGTLYLDYDVRRAIIAFNKASEDYRITIRDYSDYNSEENQWTGAVTQFNNDIIAGNVPDLIQISTEMPFQSYAAKGLFADLNPFIDTDKNFKREDFYENILEAFSVNGKLYEIAPTFNVPTLVAKSSLVGENDGWTMDEMNAALANLPEGKDPFNGEVTRNDYLQAVCSMTRDQFIDKNTGACSFDSEEFIKILEFCKTLPEKQIWESINYDEVDESFWTDREYAYRNNEALLCNMYLSDYKYFWTTQEGQFGERISFVGFPNAGRNGSGIYPQREFAISAQSSCQEGAWAFLSDFLKQQTEKEDMYQFSIVRSVNEKMAQNALEYYDEWWSDDDMIAYPEIGIVTRNTTTAEAEPAEESETTAPEDTEPKEKHWGYYIGGEQIDIGQMSQDAVDHVNAFLESLTQVYRVDDKMMEIINEEASAFFAGQKSAADAAKLIQSRVSLYISESR